LSFDDARVDSVFMFFMLWPMRLSLPDCLSLRVRKCGSVMDVLGLMTADIIEPGIDNRGITVSPAGASKSNIAVTILQRVTCQKSIYGMSPKIKIMRERDNA
jgi:hypothetical protein